MFLILHYVVFVFCSFCFLDSLLKYERGKEQFIKWGTQSDQPHPIGGCFWGDAPNPWVRAVQSRTLLLSAHSLLQVHPLLLRFRVRKNRKMCRDGELLLRTVEGSFKGCEIEHLLS